MAKRRYEMTETRIAKLQKEGRGEGIGPDYQPWIRIHDFSSNGRVHRRYSQKVRRIVQLLSDIEEDIFLKFDASDLVVDIREQFPLPRADTLRIAELHGTRHPCVKGVVAVMSTDFVIDLPGPRRIAIAVKSGDELAKRRVCEKLDIERSYWLERGHEWHLVVDDAVSHDERLHLQQTAEWASLDLLEGVEGWDGRGQDLMLEIFAAAPRERLLDVLRRVEERCGWEAGDALALAKHLLAIRSLIFIGDGRLDVFGPVEQLDRREASDVLAA